MKLLIMEFTYCQLQVLSLFISEVCVKETQNSFLTQLSLYQMSHQKKKYRHMHTRVTGLDTPVIYSLSVAEKIQIFFLKSAPNTGVNLYFEGWVWLTA